MTIPVSSRAQVKKQTLKLRPFTGARKATDQIPAMSRKKWTYAPLKRLLAKGKAGLSAFREGGRTGTQVARRDPAEANAFWYGVRDELWIDDDEITSKYKEAPFKYNFPRPRDGNGKVIVAPLNGYDRFRRALREADEKRKKMSMLPEAERK